MRAVVPERFALIKTLKDTPNTKVILANDYLLGHDNVVVKIITRERFGTDRDSLFDHFSWWTGLHHPLFAQVLDAGLTPQQHLYFVREYLPPSQLFAMDSFRIVRAMLSAACFLYEHNRVHGAIKPTNIFATKEIFKVADAHTLIGSTSLNEHDAIHFSAPEILEGGELTHESDLYSVGAVIYRILSGRHLFEDADPSRLKCKYLSAIPQPNSYKSVVPDSITQQVLKLVSRNPSDRMLAMERLKRITECEVIKASRAPLVGRATFLPKLVENSLIQPSSLRAVLLEGEDGLGKTRLLEEMRLFCAFHGMTFVSHRCLNSGSKPTSSEESINTILRSLFNAFGSKHSPPPPIVECPDMTKSSPSEQRTFPDERKINDAISFLILLAHRNPLLIAFDDIDLADNGTSLLLTLLAYRASEARLTLLLTKKPSEPDLALIVRMGQCLGDDLTRVRLPALSDQEAIELAQFLERDHEQQSQIVKLSAGNPLFVSELCDYATSFDIAPPAVKQAIASMISRTTAQTQAVLRVLSVFLAPVNLATLGHLSAKDSSELKSTLTEAMHVGLVKSVNGLVEFTYAITRSTIYASISKRERVRLNRTVFVMLKDTHKSVENLAQYALEGEIFLEAGGLNRHLADVAYGSRNYGAALKYFEAAQQCLIQSKGNLSPQEMLKLGQCYEWKSKPRLARQLYRTLLATPAVQNDAELLSAVYRRLAKVVTKSTPKERFDFLELALRTLPDTSPDRFPIYTDFLSALIRVGDYSSATTVFARAEECANHRKIDLASLQPFRGSLLQNQGDFSGAKKQYLSYICLAAQTNTTRRYETASMTAVLNNLALCCESLGDLNSAIDQQLRVRTLAITNSNTPLRILSNGNLAAIKVKFGAMREAGQLFEQAQHDIRHLSNGPDGFDKARYFLALEADSAFHVLLLGNYDVASDRLRRIPVSVGASFELDRMLCEITKCKFFLEIGLTHKVRDCLRKLSELSIFNIDYLQIERSMLEARILEIAASIRLQDLRHALALSQNLGTLYQQCELFNALATIHLELDEEEEAESCAKDALELADKNGYRLLSARGNMLRGLASKATRDRQHYLSEALQLGSEMGLQEVIAESAFHLGMLHLDSGNTITAREYLIRSTSITTRLVDGVPLNARPRYLAKKWRREALKALDRCNESVPIYASTIFSGDGDKYFAGIYQFTMAASAADSVDVLLAVIEKTLQACFSRSAVVTLKTGLESHSIPIRIKVSTELTERIALIRNHAKNRAFFESADDKRRQANAWIPLNSETSQGGIYVACRSHESPFSEKEIELLTMIGTISNGALRRLEARNAHEIETTELSEFHGIIGASKPIREIYSQIQAAAGNAATVLIEGESGTGKELVAKAIHAAGLRAKEPFIPVDCGAIPETLIEAELFGSKRGSYTGAVADRPVLFVAEHRGTIFLDEISNTTTALQTKLLRVLQEREVRRIGETKGRAIDVRLIVASNQNLTHLAEAGQFRKDLLYRLKVLHIRVPNLRSRRDDIPMLAHAFLRRLNTSNKTGKYFASNVIAHLATQKFPGNVRELQNAIERAFFLTRGIMITEVPLEPHSTSRASSEGSPVDEAQSWFKDISEGRKDFWSAIHNRYKHRDISREKVVALVDFGLRSTRGSYKTMASKFRLREKDYRRFMDFLRRNDCLLDFRPYRKAATASHEG